MLDILRCYARHLSLEIRHSCINRVFNITLLTGGQTNKITQKIIFQIFHSHVDIQYSITFNRNRNNKSIHIRHRNIEQYKSVTNSLLLIVTHWKCHQFSHCTQCLFVLMLFFQMLFFPYAWQSGCLHVSPVLLATSLALA